MASTTVNPPITPTRQLGFHLTGQENGSGKEGTWPSPAAVGKGRSREQPLALQQPKFGLERKSGIFSRTNTQLCSAVERLWRIGGEVPAPAWSGAGVQSGGLGGAQGPAHLVLWVLHLHEHAKPGGGRLVLLPLLVIQLRPVVSWREVGRPQVRGARGGVGSAPDRTRRDRLLPALEERTLPHPPPQDQGLVPNSPLPLVPITMVSSGISSIKHFFSVSPMWK